MLTEGSIEEVNPDNVVERLKSDFDLRVPEGMSNEDREKEALYNFHSAYGEVRSQFGEEWDSVEEEFRQEANTALEIVNVSCRNVGYHDKSHPVNFAAAFMTQVAAIKSLINSRDTERLTEFLSDRIRIESTPRLVVSNGKLLWRIGDERDGELVDAIEQFEKEFSARMVSEGIVAALKHDMKELEAGKASHELEAAKAVEQESVYVRYANPKNGDIGKSFSQKPSHFGAQMIYSTQYPIPGVRDVVPSGHLNEVVELPEGEDFDLTSDSIAVHALAPCFAACDYLDMMGRDPYGTGKWADAINLFGFNEKDLVRLETLAAEGQRDEVLEYFKDYPKFLLWSEYLEEHGVNWLSSVDLLGQMENPAFQNMMRGIHEPSEQLIQDSNLPTELKSRFKIKSFKVEDEKEAVVTKWEKDSSTTPARRLVRAFLATLPSEQYAQYMHVDPNGRLNPQSPYDRLMRATMSRERAIQSALERMSVDERGLVSQPHDIVEVIDDKYSGNARFHPAFLEQVSLVYQLPTE